MPPAKPIQKYRLTVKYPPSPTKTGGGFVKDEDGVKNFGDASLLNLEQGDVIYVERTHNPSKGGYDASFNIVKWAPAEKAPADHPEQQQLPIKQFTRPRTDPHDSLQIFMTALLKEWMTAYAATLMSPELPTGMRPINAVTVLQAMEALTTAYRHYHGDRIQSGADIQEPREDMDDEIPPHAR